MRQTSIYIPNELRKRLRIRAIEEGTSASRLIVDLVEEYLARSRKRERK